MATVNNENQVKFIHMSKFYVNVILLETSFLGINVTLIEFFTR